MNSALQGEVQEELARMQQVVDELLSLHRDVYGRVVTVRESTAAGAFLAQWYTGLERILKRLLQHAEISPPRSSRWHIELLELFCGSGPESIPVLFDEHMASTLAAYRSFRHVAVHGYGMDISWHRIEPGIQQLPEVHDEVYRIIRRATGINP